MGSFGLVGWSGESSRWSPRRSRALTLSPPCRTALGQPPSRVLQRPPDHADHGTNEGRLWKSSEHRSVLQRWGCWSPLETVEESGRKESFSGPQGSGPSGADPDLTPGLSVPTLHMTGLTILLKYSL